MSKKANVHNAEFKKAAVARLALGEVKAAVLAAELKVKTKLLYRWRDAYRKLGDRAFDRKRGRPLGSVTKPAGSEPAVAHQPFTSTIMKAERRRITELEQQLGRKQLELSFFKRAFAHVRGITASSTTDGATESMTPSSPDFRTKED